MKKWFGLALALSVLLSVSCSTTKTVHVMSQTWTTGAHLDCYYGHLAMYCGAGGGEKRTPGEELLKELLRGEVTPLYASFYGVVPNGKAEEGDYDVRFDRRPVDFSMLDCVKTGTLPMFVCKETARPTREQASTFAALEARQKVLYDHSLAIQQYLETLKVDDVLKSCGQPAAAAQGMTEFLAMQEKGNEPVIYRASYGSVYLSYPKFQLEWRPDGDIARINFWHNLPAKTAEEAGNDVIRAAWAVKDIPCILSNVPGMK
jgi:hypothetical protein